MKVMPSGLLTCPQISGYEGRSIFRHRLHSNRRCSLLVWIDRKYYFGMISCFNYLCPQFHHPTRYTSLSFSTVVTLTGCLLKKEPVTKPKFRGAAFYEWHLIGVKSSRTPLGTVYRNRFWGSGWTDSDSGYVRLLDAHPVITSKQWRSSMSSRITEAVHLCPNSWWFVPCLFATSLRFAPSLRPSITSLGFRPDLRRHLQMELACWWHQLPQS